MDTDAARIWKVVPFVSIGELFFGQSRSEIRSILGLPSRTFRKVPFAESEADAFSALGVQVFYDINECLESVDLGSPASVLFDGIELLGGAAEQVIKDLATRGFEHQDYVFDRAGLALCISDGVTEAVSVFARSYYDLANPDSAVNRARRCAEEWIKGKIQPGE